MLNVVMLSVVMLSVVMVNVIMLSVVMLNVVMLSVVAPSIKLICLQSLSDSPIGGFFVKKELGCIDVGAHTSLSQEWINPRFDEVCLFLVDISFNCW